MLAGPGVSADLTDALAELARGTTVGGLDVPDADYGPLNNPAQLERVQGFLRRAPEHASVLAGGHQVGERGYCFAPTVVPWACSTSAARSSSCTRGPARTRVAAVQSCPALK